MAYNSAYTGPQVDEAVGTVRAKASTWDDKQNKLSGTEDQLVGFNSAGEATAVPKPTAADLGAMPVVSGGTTGQVLTKTEAGQAWQDAPDGLPEGGTEGQVLTKTPTGAQWDDVPSDLPAGGTQGQVLTKGDGETVTWSDPASGLPTGGTPGQMLYQGGSGPEWGIPPYLESMPQLDYSQMKSLHALGITDLNNVTEPGTYVGMSNFGGYPTIANLPENLSIMPAFWMDVRFFEDPSGTGNAYAEQRIFGFLPSESTFAGFARYGNGPINGTISYSSWYKIQDSNNISFTPTSTITSDNVQDAIEEVNGKIPNDYVPNTRTINSKPLSSDVTLTAEDVGAGEPSNSTTITLTAAGWTGSAAPFSQQVECSIVAADTPVVMVDVDTPGTDADADDEATNAWALVSKRNVDQGSGTLTFYCREKPTINIPVKVGVA